jgi:hypothetical protein
MVHFLVSLRSQALATGSRHACSEAERDTVTREGPVKAQVLNKPKHDVKTLEARVGTLTLNGIPLRRKTVWAIDTDSPEFRAARKRDAKALRKKPDNGDGQQFIEAVLAEKDVQKWWN